MAVEKIFSYTVAAAGR